MIIKATETKNPKYIHDAPRDIYIEYLTIAYAIEIKAGLVVFGKTPDPLTENELRELFIKAHDRLKGYQCYNYLFAYALKVYGVDFSKDVGNDIFITEFCAKSYDLNTDSAGVVIYDNYNRDN